MKIPVLSVSAVVVAFLSLLSATSSCGAPGDLYVADVGSNSIFKFTPDGTKTTFASGLNGPAGLAFDGKGNLYETDGYGTTIFKFTSAGEKTTFASGLDSPAGLAFDGSGNLFETGYAGGVPQIFKFTPDGTKTTFASGLIPSWLAFDKFGNLYVGTPDTIDKFTPDGTRSTFASGLHEPSGLAFDASGSLFETDYGGEIFKFTPDGTRSAFVSGLLYFAGLAFDASGNLFAAGTGPGTIVKITPTGNQSVFASGLSGPVALAFEPVTEKLRNISARGLVGLRDNVLIGGFIVGGNSLANNGILLRAIGPSLSATGVAAPLADPMLELHDSSGAIIASNDDWQDSQEAQIIASGLAPTDPRESAIDVALPAGNYTAIVRGTADTTGTALVEVYSLAQ